MSDKQGTPILPPLSRGASNNGGASNGGAPQQTVSLQQVLATAQGLNVLATGSGQQFVITTQVPGLTQVIPNNSSTNANAQQVGVTRIVNIANTQSRNAATTVGGAMSAGVNVVSASLPHPSTGRQNSTKVVLATSPKLVRTSIGNVFVAPMSSSQTSSASSSSSQAALSSLSSSPQLVPSSSPVRKRLKLSESSEKPITLTGEDLGGLRRRVLEHKMRRMQMLREKYVENVAELFFLQAGGNMMDYLTWRKRPPTSQYLHFLRQRRLDSEDDDEDLTVPLPSIPELSQISSSANTTAVTATVTTPTTTTTTVTATTVAAAAAAAAAVAAATTTTVTSTIPVVTTAATSIPTVVPTPSQSAPEVKISGVGVTPVAVSTTLPAAVAQLSQHGQIPGRPQGGRHGMVFAFRAIHQSSPVTVHSSSSASATLAPTLIIGGTPVVADPSKPVTTVTTASPVIDKSSTTVVATATPKTPATITTLSNPQPIVKLVKLSTSTAVTTSCDITNNQEQIVEKAKQEAYVMQRIAELQREGLWSERRLPKVQEPARTKAHWDYLLEEMVWLAADFAQERKWKKAAAKKCARMVQKYFQEKAIQAQKAEKSQELRLKKIASFVAKEIKTFWTNVEKLVEYKQQTRLEEKRKKALDQHLNFIVGQTEKYSTWLTEGLNKTDGPQSIPASMNSSRISSPVPQGKGHSDEEFQPNQSSDDDEETIAKAEEEMKLTTNHKEEVELLKRESEIPLEDLLRELGGDYLEDRNKSLSPQDAMNETERNENEETTDGDVDFIAVSGESSDEEDTIMEEERLEGDVDHRRELDELKADNEMSIDELAAKYANMSEELMDVDVEIEGTDKESSDKEAARDNEEQSSSSESECEESDDESGDETAQAQSDAEETDVGLRSLLEDPSGEQQLENKTVEADRSDARNEMDNVAALAESIQPKGNTLLTTSVVTKIPFLLKHPLREYQHIGLDWLVTMYDRKLNGILADEMGLGKTIQTIALLAHLACEKGNWGPHLVIVPTSVMLNWEMECKKWCPGFKILTYYGTQKERKQKRTGWTKPNAFHICITSYKLVIQDHQSFRRKKWKYLILDEAQNIKNFKSQRWQLLLNFQTQRRLLLTGTPLQNNLMELWSLMHFLMPNVFQSHREFKEWFSNPVTGMIEGNSEYNENIIRRLHKVLRPFLLRRLKTEVEKQLPKKYEHVVMCRLSKRQRFLYDDFMSRAKTRETLASGNLLSVINVLMQLRKVCNHPNLFEVRPTVSPFQMEALEFVTASLVWATLDYDPLKHIDLSSVNLLLLDLELTLSAFVAHRVRRLQTSRKLIEEIDNQPEAAPRCPSGRIKINVRLSNQTKPSPSNVQQQQHTQTKLKNLAGVLPTPRVGTSPFIKSLNASQAASGQGVTLRVAGGQQLQGYSVQLVQHQGSVKAIPVATLAHNPQSTTTVTSTTATTNAQRITVGNANIRDGLQRLTAQTVTVKQGDSVQRIAMPSFAQLVQTSTGRHIILTSNQQNTNAVSFPVMTPSGQRLTVLSKSLMGLSSSGTAVNKVVGSVVTTTSGRPVMRVPPLNVSHASQTQSSSGNSSQQPQPIRSIVTRQSQKEANKAQSKEQPKSEFHLPQLEEERRQRRQAKLRLIANINERRCAACPLYGEDLFMALRIGKPSTACPWHNGWMHCATVKQSTRMRREFFSRTEALAEAIKSTERIVEELKEVFERFVVHVPAVRAPVPRFHVSHPPPHKLWNERRLRVELQHQLSPKFALLHSISGRMLTQFPDPRLIQYDCGKLQSLDRLLRKLKSDNHRVLIFTQMTRMLDVLEAFLNFHGHIYLRLDGTTRVDQRQVLMERFNGDKRIFCFILSTRSGGVGVNLTGADTVIFYDSDWNPTMDAQAQDRCHRIGQTRDVHIYRLVSEKTVEENILKKANQKRLLGDLAIEGGNFTTAYFKSSTIQDLFNIDQTENDPSARMAEVLEQSRDRERAWSKDTTPFQGASSSSSQYTEEKVAIGALESALAAAEEDLDVQAAKTAKAEAVADLAEFDENIPLDDADRDDAQVSKAEQEVQHLVSQLTPIERYAMRFIEESEGSFSTAQLAAAERELEEQKKEWELDRLRALREEEERRMRLAEDDEEKPLTFGREDAQNQIWLSEHTMEQMPMWCPPTPPTTDNDVYIDYSLGFLYENTPMSEAQLPPIYVKKERKRCRIDVGISEDGPRPAKIRHKDESVYTPKSLFERPLPMLLKLRRDLKMYKYRSMIRPPVPALGIKGSSSSHAKAIVEPDQPTDWMINEDWLLLQSIQVYQAQPINIMMVPASYVLNWDLVADIVNNCSRLYRSFKQCRTRYETVVEPCEEGKLLYDVAPKKQKKQKGSVYKSSQLGEQQSKGNKPMRTSQLHYQDKNQSFTQMSIQRFDIFKNVSNKRTPTVKPMLVTPSMKNPNNAAVLADYGIEYENPLTPMEVAERRTQRINKEKAKQVHVARLYQHQQFKMQQHQPTQQAGQQVVTASSAASQVHQLTQSAITTVANTGGITKVVTSSVTSNNVATGSSSVVTTVKARQAGAGQQVGMQDGRAATVAVASVGNVQTAQRIATASLVSTGQSSAATATAAAQKGLVGVTLTATPGTKTLTAVQLQYYRHQQMLRQQQQLKMRDGMNVSGNTTMASVLHAQGSGGQKVSVAVSATAAQQRAAAATLMKQSIAAGGSVAQTAVGKQTVARTVSETEMAALIKRQALQQQAKAAAAAAAAVAQVQVPAQAGLSAAQIFAQAGLVQQAGTSASGTPVATLVKTANVAGVRAATPQQIRQLALHPQLLAQRKLPAQKVAQLAQVAGKTGVQTQLIVQQKSLSTTMTVQQIQQVMKHVQPSTMQQFTHVSTGQAVSQASQVVLAKSPLQTRVIPVASGALKQTIQVVTAGNAQLRQATPIQGKPVTSSTVRRSPGPGPSPGPSPIPGSSTPGTAAGSNSTNNAAASSASTSNMSPAAPTLGQVRLQGITHSQQQQQQQQQVQQDAQPK
ncbi:helicase domino isoform X6 [Harpegnathos saltator]|uniref:helicase domino isoform X6 n=1 Tax=Harpegnathos saltator TaxID=610380 RepID=UPI000DBEE96C|nr:helicase domino isoform X6 [Harpegnathos saltator]